MWKEREREVGIHSRAFLFEVEMSTHIHTNTRALTQNRQQRPLRMSMDIKGNNKQNETMEGINQSMQTWTQSTRVHRRGDRPMCCYFLSN